MKGIFQKYIVSKVDGSPVDPKKRYFVVQPKSKSQNDPYARASRAALSAFADEIRSTNPKLADDLSRWSRDECEAAFRLEPCAEGWR